MLLERLTQQLIDSRNMLPSEAEKMAKNILMKRNHLNKDGSYTNDGFERDMMTPEQRAVDRAVGKYGGVSSDYKYNVKNNYAYKIKANKTGFVKWF